MRIYTEARGHWDEASQNYVLDESQSRFYEYSGPVDALKESDQEKQNRIALENAQTNATLNYYQQQVPFQDAMAKQQLDEWNQAVQMQMAYQNQALDAQKSMQQQQLDMMNKVFGQYQTTANTVNQAMTPYLSGTKGLPTGALTALNTQGMGNIAQGYSDANTALKAALLAHGGTDALPISGLDIGRMAQLQAGKANAIATMRNTNQLTDYQTALENAFRAAGVMSGQAGQMAGLSSGFSGQASQTGADVGNIATNFGSEARPVTGLPGQPQMAVNPNTKQPGFFESMLSGFAPQYGADAANLLAFA